MKIINIKEKILFSRLKSKDKQAFVRAYDLYINQIYRFVYFKVGSKEEAEDLTSAVFLKTWNYVQSGNAINYKTLRSLIYKIARNAVIDHYRKTSDQKNISIDSPISEADLIDNNQDLKKQAEIASDMELVEVKLTKLKDEYREVVVLRFINELSIAEIADVLDKSKGNVRVLVYRALKALREIVNNNPNTTN